MKVIRWLIWVPVALGLIGFAIANRHTVSVSLDPLDAAQPLLALELPLYLPVFVGLLLGLLIGGTATWFKQGKYRSAARQTGRELDRLNRSIPEDQKVTMPADRKADQVPTIQPGRKLQADALPKTDTGAPEGKHDAAA